MGEPQAEKNQTQFLYWGAVKKKDFHRKQKQTEHQLQVENTKDQPS